MQKIHQLAQEFGVDPEVMTRFVDRFAPAKVAENRFRQDAEVMLFIHIPKTAGVSVGRSLREAFDRFHSVEWNNIAQSFRHSARQALYQQIHSAQRHVVMGHFGWPEMQMFRNHDMPLKCGTFLRDPVDRTISNYNYNCSAAHPANQQFRNRFPTLQSYVESLPYDVQVTQALGFVSSFENVLDKLMRYYSFIGVTEYLSASLSHLGRSHGLSRLREYRENVGQSRRQNDVPAEIVQQITDRSLTDARLHRLMMQLYQL